MLTNKVHCHQLPWGVRLLCCILRIYPSVVKADYGITTDYG